MYMMANEDSEESDFDEVPPKRKRCQRIGICCCCYCLILCLIGGYGLWAFNSLMPPMENMCSLDASTAYNKALSLLANKYTFTEWKGLHWGDITEAGRSAAQSGNLALALKQVQGLIPDGHVFFSAEPGACAGGQHAQDINIPSSEMMKSEIGGGYGMTISPLDDGTVVVTYVAPGSSADEKGALTGEKVTHLNGVPITEAVTALGEAGWRWSRVNPATNDHRLQEQYRAVVRAPINTTSTWTFGRFARDVKLTARDDNYETWYITEAALPNLPNKNKGEFVFDNQLKHRILDSGYGYIGFGHLMYEGDYMKIFTATLNALANTPGIIVDLRGNLGGADKQAADFNGLFLPDGSPEVYYEGIQKPAMGTMQMQVELKSTPTAPFYTKPVVVLTNRDTISSGEGVAMGLSRRTNSQVVGFEGTAASFGITGGRIVFAGDEVLEFPFGRSLDANGVIQLDSNSELIGGVTPTVPVPRTAASTRAFMQYKLGLGDDIELEHAEAELKRMISSS